MKKAIANVMYPIYSVEVFVEDDASDEEIREAIFDQADYFMESGSCDPFLQDLEVKAS